MLNHIDAFEKCDEENMPKQIDFNNPNQLFQELKENAVKIEAYPQMIMILQKLSSIPNKNLFIFLEETVKESKEILEEKPEFVFPNSFQKLIKDSQKYEELLEKFETLQLAFANQEKIISKYKAEKEKELINEPIIQPPPINNNNNPPPLMPPPPLLIQTNNQNNNVLPPPLLPLVNPGLPPPNLLTGGPPPPLINIVTGGPPPPLINLRTGGPPPNLLNAPGLPGINLSGNAANNNLPPPKEKKKPKVPLKNLMWNVVPAAKVKETIWEKIDDNKVSLDVETIEKEFLNAKAKVETGKEEENVPKKKEEIMKIILLPPEKSKNIEIVLGKLKMDYNVIAQAILKCDDKILTLSTLESLIGIIPNETDLKPLREYDGERDLLSNPEKFLITLMDINFFSERLQSMKFSKIYEELVDDLELKVEVLTRFWSGVKKNPLFLQIMEYILALGNYLNGTSARGGNKLFFN